MELLRYNPAFAAFGAIAQLGERLHGMQEVSGSIPLSSTKTCTHQVWFVKRSCGAIAQLGERLHGMQEVSGSIPLSSTKIQNPRFGGGFCFYLFSCKAFSA